MSDFNLLPWREQLRHTRIRNWQWGGMVSLLATVSVVFALDQAWDGWLAEQQVQQQQAKQTMALWQAELKSDAQWQDRARMTQQVQADWVQWRQQQALAWRVMQQWLSVPPRGVQIERVVWRDQQWQINGWALSAGHWQSWQTALAVAGFSPQTEQTPWAEAQWRQAGELSVKQHPFQLTLTLPASLAKP
jgi:hypothetical protein